MEWPIPITSHTNARVKALRASLNGKVSKDGEQLGLEGWNLVREAHGAGQSFEAIFVREGSENRIDTSWLKSLRTKEWIRLSRDVFDSAVNTETPQGIAAMWTIRPVVGMQKIVTMVPVLEDVQDPGNVGTLIRSAMAFGASEVVLTPSCAGQWNPKSLRASAGAAFSVPVRREPIEESIARLRAAGARIFAAVAGWVGEHSESAPLGVLRGRMSNNEAEDFAYQATQPDGSKARIMSGTSGYFASQSLDTDFLMPLAILIGNEGAGLSDKALALADERVLIPCSTESLNAAVAGSILMYEAMRQIPLRAWAHRKGLRS